MKTWILACLVGLGAGAVACDREPPGVVEEERGPMEGDSPGTGSGSESSGAPDWMGEEAEGPAGEEAQP